MAALGFFIWGRWRYDIVALAALLTLVVAGIVDPAEAFLGFGHPAVITVAAVLVISRGLERSGFVEVAVRRMSGLEGRPILQLSALTVLVAVTSAFMNNTGALALFLPVAIRMARDDDQPASLFLMPLAFGSLLGGMVTLVGTPPNIIIATIRAEETGAAFGMFDFAPVGTGVAVAGILFIVLAGWRLLPERKGEARPEELFEIAEYVLEVRVPEQSDWMGRPIQEIVPDLDVDIAVLGILRGDEAIPAPFRRALLEADDILVLRAEPEDVDALVSNSDLEPAVSRELMERFLSSDQEVRVTEAVVQPDSRFVEHTAVELELRVHHGVNLLGVARRGRRVEGRLSRIRFQAGDVLLLQGTPDEIHGSLGELGGLPLAERGVEIGRPRRIVLAVGIFGVAIALTVTGVLPVQVALMGAALAMVATGTLTLEAAYDSVQWPVIVLLAALLPAGHALESTGGAATLAELIRAIGEPFPPEVSLAVLLVGTMLLSNVINNAAAAILMAPVALALATGLGASIDPFLMAVAIGASAAFLTPIGHQSNTLVMGPGGYRFHDYLYLGVPMSILVAVLGVPLILAVWPL